MNAKLKFVSSVLAGMMFGLALLPLALLGADVEPGYTFTSGEPNVTHTKLNTLGAGTINTTFYTGKSAKTIPAVADYVLVYSAADAAFRKIAMSDLLAWIIPACSMGSMTNGSTNIAQSAWVDVTNITATITPISTASRILVRVSLLLNVDGTAAHFRLVRDSTSIGLGSSLGGLSPLATKTMGTADTMEMSMDWLDSPMTTNATSYKVQLLQSGAGVVYFNRDNGSAPGTNVASAVSTIILQEVR